eukprot:gene1581-1728_t
MLLIVITIIVSLLCLIELFNIFNLTKNSEFPNKELSMIHKPSLKPSTYKIAIGIISVERPGGPDYVYLEVLSILDALFAKQPYIEVDKVHVFDGSFNGSQIRYFRYSRNVIVHPMDREAFKIVEHFPVHRKASLNYLLALKYLVPTYGKNVDAYLMLEDDVLFDPESSKIIHQVLDKVHSHELFLVDGYVKNGKWSKEEEDQVVIRFNGDARCCSQAFLLSPTAAATSIGLIERSLNGSAEYLPLDVYITTSLLRIPDFHFYFSGTCWVQHIGFPVMGLGIFHRGCSRMDFDEGYVNTTDIILKQESERLKRIYEEQQEKDKAKAEQ